MFNDAGVKIEPFSIFRDADGNEVTERQHDMGPGNRPNSDSDEDPWYESVRQQQEALLKQKVKDQVDSDENESSDRVSDNDVENDDELANQPDIDVTEVVALKRKLISHMLPHENVQKALLRLKPAVSSAHKIQSKKKNVRKRQKTNEAFDGEAAAVTDKNTEDSKAFEALMETAERLFELKYLDVYNDDKETIEFEANQDELKIKREADKKALDESGWMYKIEYSDGVTAPKLFGPFSSEQMEEWRKQNYFEDNDERI